MPEETKINPEHLIEFLPLLADEVLDGLAVCMGKGWEKWVKGEPSHKFKPSEFSEVERAVNYVVMALQMGLLLAKRQMELGDVALSSLKSRGVSADEIWQHVIEAYHAFLRVIGKEHSERDRISPNHFGEFLAYFASGQLREMSKSMDNEWQRSWEKRGDPFKLKPEEKAKVVHVGNCVTFVIITGLLVAKRQPELLGVDWSRGASLDVLWEGMLHTYRSFLLSEELTVEPEADMELVPRSAKRVSTAPMEAVDISPQLKSFCSDYITELGIALDVAIRVGHEEYEAGFNEAMYMLSKGGSGLHGRNPFRFGVLEKDRPRMLAEIKRYADEAGIPYNKLSPLNQFIVTIPPYVFYCLEKYLLDDPDLLEEARRLMNTKGFPRYLQEELGYPISQRIKGAFWKPNPFGSLARLFGLGHRH
jgi:hypothetical protein